MIALTIKLVIAHIIGDFILQPDSWVEAKKRKTYTSKFFYLHGLVHLIALMVLLQFNGDYGFSIVAIVVSHLFIDLAKLKLDNKMNSRFLFVVDQLLHLVIIMIVVYAHEPFQIDFEKIYATESLLFILAILSISSVSSIVIRTIMSKWIVEEEKSEDSLQSAGKYIGILERLFVFGCILLNQWSAIGLLVTAKSVFRFSDLSRAKDRKLTEYILIGTLISFGMAIVVGLGYKYLIEQL